MSESPGTPNVDRKMELRRRSLSFVDRKATDEARTLTIQAHSAEMTVSSTEETADTVCLVCGEPAASDHCIRKEQQMTSDADVSILPSIAAHCKEAFDLRDLMYSDWEDDVSVASTSSLELLSEDEHAETVDDDEDGAY